MITNVAAAVYQRVSDGTDRSVEQQNDANEEAARGFGWRTTSYSDAVSASRYSKKSRPGWERLLRDVDSGRYAYVVLWEPSRGDRKLATWAAFLDTCRAARTGIYITSHSRLYDMQNGRDWRSLAEDGVDSAYETEKNSARTTRGVAGAVEAGTPYGRIPYGYQRTYTRESRRARPMPHQEPHPDEAPVVQEIIGRIAKGEAISAIQNDLALRGIRTRAGGRWARSSITRLVTEGVVYIGKRRHNGGPLAPGNWPPIIEPDVYWRAVAVLADPARKARAVARGGIRPGAAKHLLSYIARCDVCGAPLGMQRRPRGGELVPMYRCTASNGGHAYAPAEWLDLLVTEAVVEWCASPVLYPVITGDDDKEAAAARDHAAAERTRLADYTAQAIAGTISATTFGRIAQGIEAGIARLEERAQQLSTPPALRDLLGTPVPGQEARKADIRARWEGMPLAARRKVIATLCSPTLRPARGANPLDPHRVSLNIKARLPRQH